MESYEMTIGSRGISAPVRFRTRRDRPLHGRGTRHGEESSGTTGDRRSGPPGSRGGGQDFRGPLVLWAWNKRAGVRPKS